MSNPSQQEDRPTVASSQVPSPGDTNSNRKRSREDDVDSDTPNNLNGEQDPDQPPRKKHIPRVSSKLHNDDGDDKSANKPKPRTTKKSKANNITSNQNVAPDQTATPGQNTTGVSILDQILNQPPMNFAIENSLNTQAAAPEKILVDASEIDMRWVETPPANLVRRSQKQLSKEVIAERLLKENKGTDRKVMGEVKPLLNGQGWAFKDSENPDWTKCEFHVNLRKRFIQEDAADHPPYAVAPQQGRHVDDITSQCTNQMLWTSDKATVKDPQGRQLLVDDFVRNENTVKKPADWVLPDGRVVIDVNAHAVKWFDGIPKTMSSQIEPWRVEGMRAFNSMKITDIMARMVKYTQRADGNIELLQQPSAFTNRSIDWRDANGLKSLKKGKPRKPIVISDSESDGGKQAKTRKKRKYRKRIPKKEVVIKQEDDGDIEYFNFDSPPAPQQPAAGNRRVRLSNGAWEHELAANQPQMPEPPPAAGSRRQRDEDDDVPDGRAAKKQRTSNMGRDMVENTLDPNQSRSRLTQKQAKKGNNQRRPMPMDNNYPEPSILGIGTQRPPQGGYNVQPSNFGQPSYNLQPSYFGQPNQHATNPQLSSFEGQIPPYVPGSKTTIDPRNDLSNPYINQQDLTQDWPLPSSNAGTNNIYPSNHLTASNPSDLNRMWANTSRPQRPQQRLPRFPRQSVPAHPQQGVTGLLPQTNTAFLQQHNTGFLQQHDTRYMPQINVGYPQQQNNPGYPQQINNGHPKQINPYYPQQINTGYPQHNGAGSMPQNDNGQRLQNAAYETGSYQPIHQNIPQEVLGHATQEADPNTTAAVAQDMSQSDLQLGDVADHLLPAASSGINANLQNTQASTYPPPSLDNSAQPYFASPPPQDKDGEQQTQDFSGFRASTMGFEFPSFDEGATGDTTTLENTADTSFDFSFQDQILDDGSGRLDMRVWSPTNNQDRLQIRNALGVTIEAFGKYHPESAIPETNDLTYNHAIDVLINAHLVLCAARREKPGPLPCRKGWHPLEAWEEGQVYEREF